MPTYNVAEELRKLIALLDLEESRGNMKACLEKFNQTLGSLGHNQGRFLDLICYSYRDVTNFSFSQQS